MEKLSTNLIEGSVTIPLVEFDRLRLNDMSTDLQEIKNMVDILKEFSKAYHSMDVDTLRSAVYSVDKYLHDKKDYINFLNRRYNE